jgi:hypothetical protein
VFHERVLEWALELRADSDLGRGVFDAEARALMLVGAARSLAIALAERLVEGGPTFGDLLDDDRSDDDRSDDDRSDDDRSDGERSALIRELAHALGEGAERLFDVSSRRSDVRG